MAPTGGTMAATAATALVLCLLAWGSPGIRAQYPTAAPGMGTAASPGPAGGNDCLTALTNMSDCLTYVEEGSKQKKPEKACCGELAGLVDSNPICLCQLLAKPDFAGVKLDLNKALHLPSVCGVSTPPISTCSAVGVPVSLPPSTSKANPPSPVGAAAPGPGGGNDCFTALTNMSDCLTYVEEGSKQKKPAKACCGELAGLVDSNPICLCQLLAKPDFAGIKLDLNKALHLPSVCGVSTPPVSTCSAVGVPVSLPPSSSMNSPSPTPGGHQLAPTSPSDLAPPSLSPGGSLTSPPGNGAISLINPPGLPSIFGLLATILLPIFL